jgi:hypothetical protein
LTVNQSTTTILDRFGIARLNVNNQLKCVSRLGQAMHPSIACERCNGTVRETHNRHRHPRSQLTDGFSD